MTSAMAGFALFVFFFKETATTEIYTLALPDALPMSLQELDDHQLAAVFAVKAQAASQLLQTLRNHDGQIGRAHV